MEKRYTGVLFDFFETGCEGTVWVLDVDTDQCGSDLMYDALAIIEEGDHLKVESSEGAILFDGIIHEDHYESFHPHPYQWSKIGKIVAALWRSLPLWARKIVYKYEWVSGQPVACGRWIHWTQRGWSAEDWALMFFQEQYRAELIKHS